MKQQEQKDTGKQTRGLVERCQSIKYNKIINKCIKRNIHILLITTFQKMSDLRFMYFRLWARKKMS